MYTPIALTHRSIEEYRKFVGEDAFAELRRLADPLRGIRVLNLTSIPVFDGVADLLTASVPLLNDLGLDCQWQVIRGSEEFGHAMKVLRAALSGSGAEWTRDLSDLWLKYCQMNAELFDQPFDLVIVHDPEPAPICACVQSRAAASVGRWIWHCHMDLSHAQPEAWLPLRDQLDACGELVFSLDAFLPSGPRPDRVRFIAPSIDPLGPRNMSIEKRAVTTVVERHAIDPRRPLITQIAPLDDYDDALGAVDVYLQVREQIADLQLVLIAAPQSNDHTSGSYFERVAERVADLPDVHLLSAERNRVGSVEINAFQRASNVIVQRALSRGFGVWLSEAQWKGRPVVGAPHPGVKAQIVDGTTGYFAETTADFVAHITALLRDHRLAARMGRAGRELVRQRYLLPRYLAEELRLLTELSSAAAPLAGAPQRR